MLGYLDQTLHTKKKIRIGHTSQTISPTKENHDVCKANAKPKFKQLDTRNYGGEAWVEIEENLGFCNYLTTLGNFDTNYIIFKIVEMCKINQTTTICEGKYESSKNSIC